MADDGYLIGYEDSNNNFVEIGRFNNVAEDTSQPIFIEHSGSGERVELDSNGFDFQSADVSNVDAFDSNSVSTKELVRDRKYAGSFDGGDADTRLDNALSEVSSGDTLYLERETYQSDRTISNPIKIVGSSNKDSSGTIISGVWTFNDTRSKIVDVFLQNEIVFDAAVCQAVGVNSGTVTVNADRCLIALGDNLTVSFSSGTAQGIAIGLTNSSVTDPDGNNDSIGVT